MCGSPRERQTCISLDRQLGPYCAWPRPLAYSRFRAKNFFLFRFFSRAASPTKIEQRHSDRPPALRLFYCCDCAIRRWCIVVWCVAGPDTCAAARAHAQARRSHSAALRRGFRTPSKGAIPFHVSHSATALMHRRIRWTMLTGPEMHAVGHLG